MGSISGSPHRARPAVPGRRARRAVAAAALAVLAQACLDSGDREAVPSLVLSPDSALQGASLTVMVAAPDYPLSRCPGASGGGLSLSFAGGPSAVEVTSAEPFDAETVRAQVVVPFDAPVGVHDVVFDCDGRTALFGRLTVRERLEDAAITLTPPEAKAGSFYQQIDIEGGGLAFDAEQSHVVFGDGSHVTVTETIIVDGMSTMRVFVDIPPLTPVGEMDVAVVTGDLVARGAFGILPRETPWIEVDPDFTVLTGTSLAAQTTHTITGTSVAFSDVPDGVDGGVDGGTVVGFPENPGLTVTAVEIDDVDPSVMVIDVAAAPGAAPGTTPLTVRTGGEEVSAAFTVYPPVSESAFLTASPPRVERGVHAAIVTARAFNAVPFTEAILAAADARFAEEGCFLERAELLSADELSLAVSVSEDFGGGACTLLLGSGEWELSAVLAVVPPERYMVTSPGAIAQNAGGVYAVVNAVSAGGVGPVAFDDDTTASVSARSGVGILGQWTLDEETLVVNFDEVAPDAPLGPARLRVDTHEGEIVTDYYVTPSVGTRANVVATPRSVPAEEREVLWHLESVPCGDSDGAAGQLLFDAGAPPEVEWDLPGIRTKSVSVVDSRNAFVRASLGSGIGEDMAVMYVSSGSAKAAASVLLQARTTALVAAADPELARGEEDGIVFVEVMVPRGTFSSRPVVGEVYDGVGVRVLSGDLYPDDGDFDTFDELYLQLQVKAEGPSGWFGVLLTDGRRSAVLPLRVAGEPDALTMSLEVGTADGALRPGDRDVAVEAVVPGVAPVTWILSEARTGIPAARARLTGVDGSTIKVSVDVDADAEGTSAGVPLYVITGEGAAVGFAPFVAADTAALTGEEDAVLYLDEIANPVGIVSAYPEDALSFAALDFGRPGRAAVEVALLAPDFLSEQGASKDGVVWLYGSDSPVETLLVTPVGGEGGLPSVARLRSFGEALGAELESGADDFEEPDPLSNPCASPSLVAAGIDFPLDEDWFAVGASGAACDAVAYVVARDLGGRPWSTPDVSLELREATSGAALLERSIDRGGGEGRDPRVYFHVDPAQQRLIRIVPELGSAGVYFLHARRDAVVVEACRTDGSGEGYLELGLPPGADLGEFSVELVDPESSLVVAALDLSGAGPADGVVVVGQDGAPEVDVVDTAGVADLPAGEPFAIRLYRGATLVDALQVDGTIGFGEGSPASGEGGPLCWSRLAGIDTNHNDSDFVGFWARSPGS